MSDVAVHVENLSKRYRIGGPAERYGTLRDVLAGAVHKPLKRLRGEDTSGLQEFWALRDVSFKVKHGEVLGIIGRNGAGKSTLLKILSRITEPTDGRATIHGRVGSLLEVGTGFHPELTGRENIYLNGAILGMKKAEIDQRFASIVDFAGVSQFLDTPVKRYSSGMYVRLAFTIAAHLEPDVLIVDEVLSVGDASFQSLSLSKLKDLARSGRTVIFVSHDMTAVLGLCNSACLFDGGQVVVRGAPSQVVQCYLETADYSTNTPLAERQDRRGDGRVKLESIGICPVSGRSVIRCSDQLEITIRYSSDEILTHPVFLVDIYDQLNRQVFYLNSGVAGGLPEALSRQGSVRCRTGPINLSPGTCVVDVAVVDRGAVSDHVQNALAIQVEPDDFYQTGKLTSRKDSLCLISQQWIASG